MKKLDYLHRQLNRLSIYSLKLQYSKEQRSSFEFFTVCTKLAEMALLASNDLTTAKKVTSSGARPDQEIITGLGVQCLTKRAKLACAI